MSSFGGKMNNDKMEYIRAIYAKTFLVTRKWEVMFNRLSRTDLTLKQFMLVLVVKNAFSEDPTLRQVSDVLETSHQNVKAIALLLSKKGFLQLYTDVKDKRVTRIKLLDKDEYWHDRLDEDQKSLMALFEGISYDELRITSETIEKLYQNVEKNKTQKSIF